MSSSREDRKEEKKDIIDLLVRCNNSYIGTGNHVYADIFYDVVKLFNNIDQRKLPKSPLPFHLTRDLVLDLIEHGHTLKGTQLIVGKQNQTFANMGAEEEKARIKTMSWWRRLWKLF